MEFTVASAFSGTDINAYALDPSDTIALGHGSTMPKDEQPEYSYIAVDDLKVPLPATGKGYEQVTHHRELNQGAMISPMTSRNEDSIVSQYYSFLSDPAVMRENANVTYQYVPSSVSINVHWFVHNLG